MARLTIFVGAASGGVWKSEDGGTTFKPVFDEQPVQSIGAIAIDPKNPKNVWVGTGESWTRNSVSIGNGIYRSTDGGETWTRVGLPDSERISKIIVSPENSDTVYAAVPGPLWSDSPDRGLYKTTDGGHTWNLVLKGGNLSTGCSIIAMDPKNPERRSSPRCGISGAKAGRSAPVATDPKPFSAAACSARLMVARPGRKSRRKTARVFRKNLTAGSRLRSRHRMRSAFIALSNQPNSALFVSDDGGATWDKRDKSTWMVWRPFYFANLIVDPKNPDRVFKTDGALIVSEDAGKSFATRRRIQGAHGDVHDVWIDPTNPQTRDRRRRRRHVVFLQRRKQMVEGEQPSDLAVLSRERGRRRSVPRLRRPAGQQLAGSATRNIPAASTIRSGKTCMAATASGCFPIRRIPIISTPNIRAATSAE